MKKAKMSEEEKELRKQKRKQDKWDKEHKLINGEIYKLCNKHKEYFPEEDEFLPMNENIFSPNLANSIDGFHPCCKRCNSEKSKDWVKIHPAQYENYWKERNKNPNELRVITLKNYWKERKKSGYEKDWRRNHPEKSKEYNQKHRNHDITPTEWYNCKKVFNFRCAYCGLPIENHLISRNNTEILSDFHKEHIDDEGYNDLRNCVPSCRDCNSSKHQDIMEDWYKRQSFFSQDKLDFIIWWINEGYKNYIEDKPPYRIIRERNEDNRTYHYNLWSVDEKRNLIEIIVTENQKKDLDIHIKNYLVKLNNKAN